MPSGLVGAQSARSRNSSVPDKYFTFVLKDRMNSYTYRRRVQALHVTRRASL